MKDLRFGRGDRRSRQPLIEDLCIGASLQLGAAGLGALNPSSAEEHQDGATNT